MYKWRLYIDESGDHTYKHIDNDSNRYLGITGVLIQKLQYDTVFQPKIENLKRLIFHYDPDNAPIFVRSLIRGRKQWFYVLQDATLNAKWEQELLDYLASLKRYAHIFTVVIDKKQHKIKFPSQTFDPYVYSLHVLLNRVRGLLNLRGEQADVMAESRGSTEDKQIENAYKVLRSSGTNVKKYGDASYYNKVFPHPDLLIRKKYQNIAGLQIADLLAHDQKLLTIDESKRPLPTQIGTFGNKVNIVVNPMVNKYGRYLLV